MLSELFKRVYKRVRGYDIDEIVPPSVVASFLVTRIVALFRGSLSALFYGAHANMHFRGARCRIANRRYLRINNHVIFGDAVTIDAYSRNGIFLDDSVTIGSGTSLMASVVVRERGEGISIGKNTSIGRDNVIWGQGGVQIGSDCLLGPQVIVVSENHNYEELDKPIRSQGGSRAAIVIEDDCWLGAGVKVMAGVRIGRGSVVGAGAVVTKSIAANSIVGGVPARLLKVRGE